MLALGYSMSLRKVGLAWPGGVIEELTLAQMNKLLRDKVESNPQFCGFLVSRSHYPVKEDAVETLKILDDSSHRVCSRTSSLQCAMLTSHSAL